MAYRANPIFIPAWIFWAGGVALLAVVGGSGYLAYQDHVEELEARVAARKKRLRQAMGAGAVGLLGIGVVKLAMSPGSGN